MTLTARKNQYWIAVKIIVLKHCQGVKFAIFLPNISASQTGYVTNIIFNQVEGNSLVVFTLRNVLGASEVKLTKPWLIRALW